MDRKEFLLMLGSLNVRTGNDVGKSYLRLSSVHNSWHYDISMWMVSSTLRYKIYDLTVSPTSCCEIISRAAMENQHLADSADYWIV